MGRRQHTGVEKKSVRETIEGIKSRTPIVTPDGGKPLKKGERGTRHKKGARHQTWRSNTGVHQSERDREQPTRQYGTRENDSVQELRFQEKT